MKGQKVILTTLCFLWGTGLSMGCGPEFDTPKNHFDGVNQFGDLSYWQKIGELDLGDGLALPLIINFRSNRESVSPFLGKSWILTPFDVAFVQLDENRFIMNQPNGTMTRFARANPNETLLRGQGTWLAEIKGPTITAYASCGWTLQFNRGKLVAITTPKNRKVDFIYVGNQAAEIKDGSGVLLKVEKDLSASTHRLIYHGHKITIEQAGRRPNLETINGQNLTSGVLQSLSKIATDEGYSWRFEYGLTNNMDPFIEIDGRKLIWNAQTKKIKFDSDGGWIYKIQSEQISYEHAAIQRENTQYGISEFWHHDKTRGIEIKRDVNGVETMTKRFVSGPLSGRLRSITEKLPGGPININRWTYDEHARLLRVERNADVEAYSYDSTHPGVEIILAKDDKANTLYRKEIRRKADESRIEITRFSLGSASIFEFYDSNGVLRVRNPYFENKSP